MDSNSLFGYRGKSAWTLLLYLVTEARVLGHYFSIWLQSQECLDITSLFGYRGNSARLQRQECLVTEARVPGYRGKSAWTIGLLLYLVTEAKVLGHYFSIWLQRQECLDITSLSGYRGKCAWTSLLYLVTEARVPGHHFSIWIQRQECLVITSLFGYKGKSASTLLLYWLQRRECLVITSVFGYKGKNAWTLLLYLVTEARVPGHYFCLVTKASVPGQSAV